MSETKQNIEYLYGQTPSNWNVVGVSSDTSTYYMAVAGTFSNTGWFKVHQFDVQGRLLKYGNWINAVGVGTYEPIFNVKFRYEGGVTRDPGYVPSGPPRENPGGGIGTTPPPAPPTPPSGPNLETIETDYSLTDGYGEADVHNALEDLLEITIPEEAPVGGNFQEDLYGIDAIGAPEAWLAGYTGQDIIVAVIDTGVDVNHIELDNNIWQNTDEIPNNGIDDDNNGYIDDTVGWDWVNDDNTVEDLDGHGTHVAGTIAAENNGIGLIGAAYDAKIMPIKVLPADDEVGGGTWEDLAAGIRYAVDNGAHVINMSLGGGYFPPLVVQDAIEYANDNNVICVMAAGNAFIEDPVNAVSPEAPGNFASEFGIVVGAVDSNGNMASFSNRAGNPIDWKNDGDKELLYVTSAGVGIWSTLPNDSIGALNGTSMATPLVAAACAILLQADPSLTPDQIRVLLANNTK